MAEPRPPTGVALEEYHPGPNVPSSPPEARIFAWTEYCTYWYGDVRFVVVTRRANSHPRVRRCVGGGTPFLQGAAEGQVGTRPEAAHLSQVAPTWR